MNYINNTSKKIVGRNNNTVPPLVIDYDCLFDLDFSFIDQKNQIQPLENLSGLYIAGGLIGVNETMGDIIFLCEDYSISGNTLTFHDINTYTESFLSGITKKYTQINIEIGQYLAEGQKQVYLRDICLACPRVRVRGQDPVPISGDYYTKEELNEIVNDLSSFVITETEATKDLINLTPYETLSGASGVVEKGKVYTLDMTQDFTLSVKLPEGLSLEYLSDTVKDEYNVMTKTITRNIHTYTFTGDENWSINGYNSTLQKYSYGHAFNMQLKSGTGQVGYCDRYEVYRGNWTSETPNNCVRFGQSNAMFYFFSDDNMTLAQMQAATSGMTVKYQLANPWQEQLGGPYLRSVGDVSDTYDPETGIITRRIGVHKFTENDSITSWRGGVLAPAPSTAGYFDRLKTYPLGIRGQEKVLINAPGLGYYEYGEIYAGRAYGWCGNTAPRMADYLGPFFRVNPDDFTYASEIPVWLARNGVEMWYIFETPREEHFTTTPVAIEIGDPRPNRLEDYGEAVLFVRPHEYTFTTDHMLLDAEMGNFSTYRMLVSWTPVGVLCEQTGAWTD